MKRFVGLFWTAALFYAAFGFIFAIPFVLYWSGLIDSAAKSGSWGFRLAILPGAVALWPLMALKTIRAFRQRYLPPDPEQPVSPMMQRRIHGVTVVFLAGLLPVICTSALLSRPREQLLHRDAVANRSASGCRRIRGVITSKSADQSDLANRR